MPKLCNCEDESHFDDGPCHPYLGRPAGDRVERYAGPVCDPCADTHAAPYLYTRDELAAMADA